MSDDPIILNFHEALLHKSDIDLLSGPHWLNDIIINFYFEYLEKIAYKDENKFLFVSPDVTQCLKISPSDDMFVFLDPLQAKKRDFIFLVLNNCEKTDSPGGTHWSLLVNFKQAWQLASNLFKYLSCYGKGDFQELDSLQQVNGYDCGIHVLCNVDLVAAFCAQYNKIKGCGKVGQYNVATKRAEILYLIESLT
ncbi:Sentrin-specific protease 8 [Zootermopsis nevadensis]|uniref:Sentrin-specific protease 8 n=1 Tax=Zootermopsis nevadensis TaxID=136037 RepID=A0A067RJR1_ZOONE|nr:Sentrin-specific protease 8 [Zootermopsis nevadensis]